MHGAPPVVFSNKQMQLISANLEKRFVRTFRRKNREDIKNKRRKMTEMRNFDASESSCLSNNYETTFENDEATIENEENIIENDESTLADESGVGTGVAIDDFNGAHSTLSDHPPSPIAHFPIVLARETIDEHPSERRLPSSDLEDDENCAEARGNNLVTGLNLILAKHGTADEEAKDWISFMKTAFPHALIPSFKSLKRRFHLTKDKHEGFLVTCPDGQYWILNFMSEIYEIVNSNKEIIAKYSSTRDEMADLKVKSCFDSEQKIMTISLILNSDGVCFVKSSRLQLWPFWLAIANLPPIKRSTYKNIVLAALLRGTTKPDWEKLVSDFSEKLSQQFTIEYNQVQYKLVVKIVLIVADIPARASMLNMHHHRAKYGCTLCLTETQAIGKSRYFLIKKFQMRRPETHRSHLQALENGNLAHFKGVKGKSPFIKIVPKLPLTAPFDVMHQVYLGVTKVLLEVIEKKTHRNDLICLNNTVATLATPVKIKRSIRPLDDLKFFKANELKVWLLYVGPALFGETINEVRAQRFWLLSYGIRLLLASSNFCKEAERQINQFLRETKDEYTEQVFSANIHSLSHLTWQVQNFGPLWTTSSMMFESANYQLCSKFTGTVACELAPSS